jgi:hypothetical protein
MDSRTICKIADELAKGQGFWPDDLDEKYRFLGIPETGHFPRKLRIKMM